MQPLPKLVILLVLIWSSWLVALMSAVVVGIVTIGPVALLGAGPLTAATLWPTLGLIRTLLFVRSQ